MSFQKKNEKLDYLSLLLKLLPILVFVLILYFWNRQKLIIEEINNNYLPNIKGYQKISQIIVENLKNN